jgi:hypothetical protein
MPSLSLTILENLFAIHRFAAGASIPKEVTRADFFAVTRTNDELSVVAPEDVELKSEKSDRGWACIQVNGPLKLSQVGLLADLSAALAKAQVSIFVLSTFDTDYLLVKAGQLEQARAALEAAGYKFRKPRKKTVEEPKSLTAFLKQQVPLVQKLLMEKVGTAALATLKSDEAWAVALGSVYEFLPTAMRLVVPRDTFVNFFVRNRTLILPASLKPTPAEAQAKPVSAARATANQVKAGAKTVKSTAKRSK